MFIEKIKIFIDRVQCKKLAKKDISMLRFYVGVFKGFYGEFSRDLMIFGDILCFVNRFYIDFLLDFMFFPEILCWRSFYKSLRNCPNRCQRVSKPSV